MFMGTFEHSIDPKGRVIIPAKLRDELGDSFVVTVGLDGCLYAYPMDEWESLSTRLKELPGNRETRAFQRAFMANAATCDCDKQGRTLIPANLREKVGIDKEVVFIGVLGKVEIWSKERYESGNDTADLDMIDDHMSEFGLSF